MSSIRPKTVSLACVLWTVAFGLSAWSATPDAVILRIQDDIQAGRAESAAAEIEAALKDYPRDGGLYNLRGIVHANRNELRAAEADFTKAINLNPRLEAAYLNLGRTCDMLSIGDPAVLDRVIVQHRKFLTLEPGSHDVRLQLAKFLEERADYGASLRELVRLPPVYQNRGLVIALRCADLAGLGRQDQAKEAAKGLTGASDVDEQVVDAVLPSLLKSKSDPILIRLFELAARRGDLSAPGRQELAAAYERSGQLVEARQTLEAVASHNPTAVQPLLEMARIAQKQNDLKGALGYLAHARDLEPNYAPVHFFFGIVCIELDLPVEAKKSLQKAVDLDPGNPSYNYARGSVELQGRSAWQAIPYFKKFIAAEPNDPRGHFALGVAEFASQDYESSEKEMRSICDRKETMAGAEYFLGRIAKADSNWAEASRHFEKSTAVDAGYADSHAELGLALMHLGDLTGARREIDRALQLNPDSYIANGNFLTLLQRTKDPLAAAQEQKLHQLDSQRSEKQELMIRTIKMDRYPN